MRASPIHHTLAAILGVGLIYLGLVRLGWCRHGASPLDFSFLHLDWLLRPSLPFWRAHMENFATFAAGFPFLGWGAVGLTRSALRGRRPAAGRPR
ncbi:MAG: hypothetical protein ABIO70_07285 [Pseudomonadota bacterium]